MNIVLALDIGPPNHIGGACQLVCVQGVHLSKEVVVFSCPLMLVMPVLGLHLDLDQLEDEATPQFAHNSHQWQYWSHLSFLLPFLLPAGF